MGRFIASAILGLLAWPALGQQEAAPRFIFRLGSVSRVEALAFSRNGKLLVSSDARGMVYAWDVGTGKQRWAAKAGVVAKVLEVAPDEKVVAAGASDGAIRLFDGTGQAAGELKTTGPGLTSLAFSDDGKLLAAGSDVFFDVWEWSARKVVGPPNSYQAHDRPAKAVHFLSQNMLAVAERDQVCTWDLQKRSAMGCVPLTLKNVRYQWSADGKSVAQIGDSGRAPRREETRVRIWNEGGVARDWASEGFVAGLSPDLQAVLVCRGRTCRLVDKRTNKDLIQPIEETRKSSLLVKSSGSWSIVFLVHAFSGDGKKVALATEDQKFTVADLAATDKITLPASDQITALAFTTDGRFLAVGTRKNTQVWDVASRRAVKTYSDASFAVAIRSQGDQVQSMVTGDGTGRVSFWDLRRDKKETQRVSDEKKGPIKQVEVSRDGKIAATIDADGTLTLWNAESGKRHGVTVAKTSGARFLEDGSLATVTYEDRQWWSYRYIQPPYYNRTTSFWFPNEEVVRATFSRDGSVLLTTDDRGFWIRELGLGPQGTESLVRENFGRSYPGSFAVSEDGRRFVTASTSSVEVSERDAGEATPWKKPRALYSFGVVQALALSSGMLAAGDLHGTVHLSRNAETRSAAMVALADGEYVTHTPDGRYVASTMAGEQVTVNWRGKQGPLDDVAGELKSDVLVARRLGGGEAVTIAQVPARIPESVPPPKVDEDNQGRLNLERRLEGAKQKSWTEAIPIYDAVLREAPRGDSRIRGEAQAGRRAAYKAKGDDEMKRGAYEAAYQSYTEAQYSQGQSEARYQRALADIMKKDWAAAGGALASVKPDYRATGPLTLAVQLESTVAAAPRARYDLYATAVDLYRKLAGVKDAAPTQFEWLDKMGRAQNAYELGEQARKAGQFVQARVQFVEALRVDPDHAGAKDGLQRLEDEKKQAVIENDLRNAQSSLERRDWAVAIAHFDSVLQNNPGDVRAIEGKLIAEESRAKQQRAWIIWGGASSVVISAALWVLPHRRRRARFFESLGWKDEAIRTYLRRLEDYPTDRRALTRVATLSYGTPEREKVAGFLDRYVSSVEKPDAEMWFFAAEYGSNFWYYIDALLRGYPAKVVCQRLLAFPVEELAVNREIVKRCEAELAKRPDDADWNLLLARMYLHLKVLTGEGPVAVFRKAIESMPDNRDLRYYSAFDHLRHGRGREALADARALLPGMPESEALQLAFLIEEAARQPEALNEALDVLSSGGLSAYAELWVWETIVERVQDCRNRAHERYLVVTSSLAADVPAVGLYRAHLLMDDGRAEACRELIRPWLGRLREYSEQETQLPEFYIHKEWLRVCRRWLALGQAVDPDFLFDIAEMHRAGWEWHEALRLYQRLAAIPEQTLRCRSAMERMLQWFGTRELGALVFGEAGKGKEPWESFDGAMSAQDVFELRARAGGAAYIFALVPARPRQEAFAAIYSLLGGSPPFTVVPLEAAEVRTHLIEGNLAEWLNDKRDQWLGKRDLYDVRNPVSDAATFFGRGKFLRQLTGKILAGENFGLYGLRKVGKTSLVFQLRDSTPRDVLVAYVDLQAVSSASTEEVYFRMADALAQEMRMKYPSIKPPQFRLRGYEAGRAYPDAAGDFHNDLLDVKTALEGTEFRRVLLLMDEVERIIPYGRNAGFRGSVDFFRHVRGLYQQHRFVVSAVVGADPTLCRQGKWGDQATGFFDNPVFQYYDEVFLTPLERSECDDMIAGLGCIMGVHYKDGALEAIYEESAGHPFIARQLASRLTQRDQRRPLEAGRAQVADAVMDYVARSADYLREVVTLYISDYARLMLEAVAQTAENRLSRSDLFASAARAGVERDAAAAALQDLELFHLLARDQETYRIPIRVMRSWIRSEWLGMEDESRAQSV